MVLNCNLFIFADFGIKTRTVRSKSGLVWRRCRKGKANCSTGSY